MSCLVLYFLVLTYVMICDGIGKCIRSCNCAIVHSVHNIQIRFMCIPFRAFSIRNWVLFLELLTKAVKLNFIAIQFQLDQCHLNNHLVAFAHGVDDGRRIDLIFVEFHSFETNLTGKRIFIRKTDL